MARSSTGAFHRNNGAFIEGAGIAPDIDVRWTIGDFRAGRDSDLEAAERLF